MITLCFLLSAEHYYATRERAPMNIEEHEALSAIPQDTDVAAQSEMSTKKSKPHTVSNNISHPANKDILEPHIHNDHDITASLEAVGPQHQEEPAPNSVESIPIPQALQAVYFPVFNCFQIGASQVSIGIIWMRSQLINCVSRFNTWGLLTPMLSLRLSQKLKIR